MSTITSLVLRPFENVSAMFVKKRLEIKVPEGYTQVKLCDILRMIPVEVKADFAGPGIIPEGFIV